MPIHLYDPLAYVLATSCYPDSLSHMHHTRMSTCIYTHLLQYIHTLYNVIYIIIHTSLHCGLLLCVFIYTVRMRSTAVHSLTAVFRVLRLKSLCCPSLGQSCRMRGFNSEEDRSVTQCSPDHYCKSSSWCVLHAIML